MHADPNKGGGVFCGPLRLLALEVYEQLNDAGNYCSLLTGQERKEIPFETHVSCTIEMVRFDTLFFVLLLSRLLCTSTQVALSLKCKSTSGLCEHSTSGLNS